MFIDIRGIDSQLTTVLVCRLEGNILQQTFQHRMQAPCTDILGLFINTVGNLGDALDTALDKCDSTRNPKVHELLSRMRAGEQEHADWIAAQIDEIAR